jgi:hypothetical protein
MVHGGQMGPQYGKVFLQGLILVKKYPKIVDRLTSQLVNFKQI